MTAPKLSLSPERAVFILLKARAFGAKVENTDPNSGSNPSDDGMVDALEDTTDDAIDSELTGALRTLNDDERLDLIAMIWLGRGDFSLAEWDEARDAARDIGRGRIVRYVRGIPMVSDYLADALAQLGHPIDEALETPEPPLGKAA